MMLVLTSLALLGGCRSLCESKGWCEYLKPTVAEVIFLGVEEPNSPELDLEGTEFEEDAALTVALADASDVSDLDNAPINDAVVSMRSESNGVVPLKLHREGVYYAAGNGLSYPTGENFNISIAQVDDDPGTFDMTAPPPVRIDIDPEHSPGQSMNIDISRSEYDAAVVVVIDMATQTVTFDNRPITITDIYNFTHPDAPINRVEIPGRAFADRSVYAVGVGGMFVSGEGEMDNVNAIISACMVGQMRFYPVTTIDIP